MAPQQPLTSVRWVIGALAATLSFAALGVYITLCLLFWQGQWQLVFHPSRIITTTPASAGLRYDEVSFAATETGILQLNGWWIPAEPNAPHASDTLLLLHEGSGSLSDMVPNLPALHSLGIDIFAFDYRGFGKSANLHPSEASTYDDADAAWHYLTETRHLAPSSIALYGIGLGSAMAAETARRHPEAPALLLQDPQPPTLTKLKFDAKTQLLPVRLLFHDRFDLAKTLADVHTPKLLLHGNDMAAVQSFLAKYLPGA